MVVVIGRKKPSAKLAPEQYAIEEAHSQALTLTEEQYQNFDVVWAKLGSYPWWPAVLFYSWKAVNDAGLELKTVQQQLVIPPPKTIELEDGKGKKQIHYVLIMFLDKFNCNIIEISPKTICPFSINYDHLVKGKAKTGFKVALARAMRLLHMDQHMTVDELIEIAAIRVQQTPPEYFEIPERSAGVKKQKRSSSKKPTVLQLVEETEDEYEAIPNDDLEDDDDESDYSESKKPSRGKAAKKLKTKPAAKASHGSASKSVNAKKTPTRLKRPNSAVKYLEAIDSDEEESSGDFEVMATSTKAAAKATSSRKKASRKEGRNHHDVITVDDDDGDSHEEFTVQVASQPKASSKLLSKVKSSKSGKAKLTVKAPKDAKKVGAKSKPKKTKTMKTAQSDSEEFTDYHEEPTEPAQPKKSKKSSKRAASPGKIAPSPKEPVQPLTLTPLSTIWTTRVSNQEGDKASGSDERLAYKLDLLWDDTTFTDPQPALDTIDLEDPSSINARGGMKRQGRSVQQSQIRQSLLTGNLDPHTMVQCEPYLPRGGRQISTVSNRSRGPSPQLEAPYDVVVHPDVVFVCDLHAHLATCEIIGFLGGKWDDATKTLYIQAAFPCRSLVIDGDDGSTDVEMDPGSEIELREIIQNAELEVVGWYHSHPAFAPDPSVRDIENQGNYQQLFQRRKQTSEGRWEVAEPFVGLIVGTYDSRRDSPVGLFRYFHVRGERVSSSSTREISMPYELVPRKREYRSVVADENQTRWRRLPLYISVATILYGANAAFRKAPRLPSDGISLQKRHVLLNGLHDASVHSDDKRKRKLSTGELAAGENGKQKGIKKPRSRRLKALESAPSPLKVSVENAGNGGVEREVIDLMSDPSQTEVEVVKLVIDVNAHEDACEADNSIAVDVEKNTDPSEVPAPTSDMGASSLKTESSTPNKNDQEDVTMCDQDDKRGNDVQITEEIICQSQDSQHDAAQPVLKSPAEMNYPEHISTKNEDETVGPSSSSSQSEHFFNYEASQSQSYSTQSNSQVDESAVQDSSGLTSCTDMDAVYAGVDLYEPDVVTPSDSLNTTQVLKVAVKQDSYSAQADGDDFVSDSAHDSNMHSDGSMHTLDEPVAVVGDEAIKPKDDRTVDSVPLHQSSIQDESGSNSAVSGGVSTPIDPSVLPSGRRRNRKPSTTIRHVDTSDSLVQRSVSSPHSTTSAFVARGPSQVDDADTTSAAPDDDKLKLKAKEGRSGSEEMIWDGVEVIVDDSYAADSVPVPESPVSYDSSVQNHLTSDVVLGTKAEIGEQNQHPSSTPDVDRVIKVDDPANPVDVTVVREINEIADIVDVSQTSDENESMQSDQPIPDHGMRPVFQQLVEDDSMIGGLVCEPLEGCHVTVLRMVASQLKLKIPPTDRRKDGLIRAIRAHQKEAGTASQKPNSEVLDHVHTKGDSNPVDDANLHKPDKELIEASAWEVKHSAVEEEDLTSQAKSPEKHFAVEIRLDAKPVEEDPRGMDAEVLSIAHIQQDDALVVKSEPTEPKVADQKPLKQELKPELESPDVSSNQSLLLAQPEKIEVSHDLSIQEQIDCHLRALRTSYGDGIYGCAEQVITLIDYYRDFDRRTNLNDTWKGKVTKLQKLEASLLADVMLVNVPVALRESFVKDVIGYLRTSWGAALQ